MVTECLENGGFSYQSLFERLQPYRKEYPMLDWSKQSIYNPAICRGWANDDKKMSKSYKKAVVTEALLEYIQRRKQVKIIHLFGTIEYESDYNYKEQRKVK